MQTLRKLSSKKGKFEGLQLGEVVSKNINKIESPKDAPKVTQVITHSNTISSSNKNKESVNKRAEQVAHAIQKRHDYYNIKKMLPKEQDVTSPIISIKLVKNESPKIEKKRSDVKPRLVSESKRRQVSFSIPNKKVEEKPRLVSPSIKEVQKIIKDNKHKIASPIISKKELSPTPTKKIASPSPTKKESSLSVPTKKIASPTVPKTITKIEKRQRSPSPSRMRYKTVEVRTILDNYEYPVSPYITDARYKVIKKYINIYKNMPHAVDKILLASISSNISF
jgi:hypothetical protein